MVVKRLLLLLKFSSADWTRNRYNNESLLQRLQPRLAEKDYQLRKYNSEEIFQFLIANYDNSLAPHYGRNEKTKVYSDLQINGFGPVSVEGLEFGLNMFFRVRWFDDRLVFTKDRLGKTLGGDRLGSDDHVEQLILSSKATEDIWTPDTYFHNTKSAYQHKITVPNSLLRINENGWIIQSMRLTVNGMCNMKLSTFPFDSHTCNLTFGSFSYLKDELDYSWTEEKIWKIFDKNLMEEIAAAKKPISYDFKRNSRLTEFKLLGIAYTKD